MNIIGISGGFGHDASAALMVDGHIKLVVEEERVTRHKHARGKAATQAILACLREAGDSDRDIDAVALSWDSALDSSNDRMHLADQLITDSLAALGLAHVPLLIFNHHLSHAVTAMLLSGTRGKSISIVMDGRGETASTSLFLMDGLEAELLSESGLSASLGTFYAAATTYCGFGYGGQGRTMALAAYGQPGYDFPELSHSDLMFICSLAADGDRTRSHRAVYRKWLELYETKFGPKRNPNLWASGQLRQRHSDSFSDRHADAAASAQATLERVVTALVDHVAVSYPELPIILSGGVALNCSMNGLLRRIRPSLDIRLQPMPHDAGVAIGAAALAANALGDTINYPVGPYLGVGWPDSEIADLLRKYGLSFGEPSDLTEAIADRILSGQVIGWFQGRAEVGPRALGHRSILASPFDGNIAARLNSEVKFREGWRPFGPSVLADEMEPLFGSHATPFMVEACLARNPQRIPAVTHVDGTSRPHTVDLRSCSSRYLSLIEKIQRDAGIGAVLNTSFNQEFEPIVYTPDDALRTFFSSTLDALALGPFLLFKDILASGCEITCGQGRTGGCRYSLIGVMMRRTQPIATSSGHC